MRQFDFKKEYIKLLTPDIVAMMTAIHDFRGEQSLYMEADKDALAQLLEIAKIQSTEASNWIEGIITTDERLKKIVREKTMPKTRSEKEIAGYRDVLNTIHEKYDYIPPRSSISFVSSLETVLLSRTKAFPLRDLSRGSSYAVTSMTPSRGWISEALT